MKFIALFLLISSSYAQIGPVNTGNTIEASKFNEVINQVNSNTSETCYVKHVLPAGINEGGTVGGTYTDRALNTTEGSCSFLTLSASQFTLIEGNYDIFCSMPTYFTQRTRALLTDTGNTPVILGGIVFGGSSADSGPDATLMGSVSVSQGQTQSLKLRMFAQRSEPSGLGLESIDGREGIFSQCRIERKP